MRLEWFVARRYLRSPHRPAVLRLVTVFSVVGVAAGVATLVIALAMNTGFRETLQDRLLGVTRAHLPDRARVPARNPRLRSVGRETVAIPGVRSVTPAVYQTVLMSFAGEARGVVTQRHRSGARAPRDEALQRIVAGELDFAPDKDGIDALLVGKQLADEWQLSPGDYVTLTSPQGRLTPFGLLPRSRRFRIAGVFDSGFYDYDQNWCFLTLAGSAEPVRRRRRGERAGVPARAIPTTPRQIARPSCRRSPDLDYCGDHVDGRKPRAVPRVAPGKAGHGDFHRPDHVSSPGLTFWWCCP